MIAGLAVAGSGIGTFLFAPFIEYLIQEYSWRGAVIILGGIMLEMVLCGAVFRPLVPPHMDKHHRRDRHFSGQSSSRVSSYSMEDMRFSTNQDMPIPSNSFGPDFLHPYAPVLRESEPATHSLVQFPTYLRQSQNLSVITPDLLRDLKHNGRTLHEFLAEHNMLDEFYAIHSLSSVKPGLSGSIPTTDARLRDSDVNLEENLLSTTADSARDCDDTFLNATLTDPTLDLDQTPTLLVNSSTDVSSFKKKKRNPDHIIKPKAPREKANSLQKDRIKRSEMIDQFQPLYRKDIFYRGNLVNTTNLFVGRSASCPNILIHKEEEKATGKSKGTLLNLLRLSKEVKHVMQNMLDFSIFRSGIFIYFCLSSMLLYMAYDVPYVYTVDKAITDLQIGEKRASFLVSIIGITSTVGQIVIGYIGDKPCVDALHLYNALTSISGAVTMVVPLLGSYALLATYCGAFGFFISANYALTTIILVDLLGMDKLTNAYGIVMLGEGIANVIGPPLAGESQCCLIMLITVYVMCISCI